MYIQKVGSLGIGFVQLWIDVWESVEWGVLQQMEITLDGLIWDLGVLNYGFG